MGKINELRFKIDEIDKKLLKLVVKRVQTVEEIGLEKQKSNIAIFDKKREKEVIAMLIKHTKNENISPQDIKRIWRVLMEISYEIEGGKNGKN